LKRKLLILLIMCVIFSVACSNQRRANGAANAGTGRSGEDSATAPVVPDNLDYADLKPVPLPKGFPDKVYLYAEAKTIAGFRSARGYAVTLFTKDGLDTVVATYRQRAELEQWRAFKVLSLLTQAVINYKSGSVDVSVRIARKVAGSLITVSVQ